MSILPRCIPRRGALRRYRLVLLAALGFPPAATAQDAADVEPVVVRASRVGETAERLPAAVSVLGPERIRRARRPLGLAQPLTGVPGVFARNRWNFAQDLRVAIRGFGARANFGIRGIRVLVDGIPATAPDGQTALDDVDPAALARIEVLRGPAAAWYGASSGGVLALYTEEPGGPPYVEAGASAGEHGYRQARVQGSGGSGDWAYRASLSGLSVDGYREQSAAERDVLDATLAYRSDPGRELTLNLALLDAPQAQDPGGLTAAEAAADPSQASPLNLRFDTGETVTQQRAGVAYRQDLGARDALRLRAYAVQRDFANRLPFSATELDRRLGGAGVEYLREIGTGGRAARLLLGADLDRQDDLRRRRENDDGRIGELTADQREQVRSDGAFVRWEQPLAQPLRLDLGLRYDRVVVEVDDRFAPDGDDSGTARYEQLSPSAALLWRPAPAWGLYGRIATAFETPTTTELADPDGSGGINTALEPQTALSVELGARGRWGPATLELAAYRTEIRDQLVPFEIPSSPGRFAFQNAGASTLEGLEAAAAVALSPRWELRAAYTFSDLRYDRFVDRAGTVLDGNRVPGVPRHLLDLALTWRHPGGLFAAWEGRYVGSLYADDTNRVEVDAYTVTDLRAGYDLPLGRHWLLGAYAGVDNLLDARYDDNIRINATGGRYFEPAPPRSVYAGVSVGYAFD